MTEQLFTAIAKEHLSIETLETRRSDSTMSLSGESAQPWEAAYKAGANAERNAFRRSTITVLEKRIEKAGDLYAAIDGVTDQFDDELRALTKSSDAAVKLANKLRRGS